MIRIDVQLLPHGCDLDKLRVEMRLQRQEGREGVREGGREGGTGNVRFSLFQTRRSCSSKSWCVAVFGVMVTVESCQPI